MCGWFVYCGLDHIKLMVTHYCILSRICIIQTATHHFTCMQIISLVHHQAVASTHTVKSHTSSTHTTGHMGEVILCKFKVCKSVHHRTIQINHQPDATIFQFIILTFIYSSTCLGRFRAHHQELNDCSGSLWFYLCIVVIVVLCLWSGQL